MKVLILGDVHGCWSHMNTVIADAIKQHPDITHIVQVGDFGYGWPGIKPFKASKGFLTDEEMAVYDAAVKLWIDGNHENHDRLDADHGAWQPDWSHMKRGSVLTVDGYCLLFHGGATSADKQRRIEGVSWWRQESISYGKTRELLSELEGPIHAVFSHEHPAAIPYSDERYGPDDLIGMADKRALDAIRLHVRPEFWFFGHHHKGDQGTVEGMEWVCCPIIEARQWTIWTGETIIKNW